MTNRMTFPWSQSDEFAKQLDSLAENSPQVAAALRRAHENRIASLISWHTDERVVGIDQLIKWLVVAGEVAKELPSIADAARVIYRAAADFEMAIEATASGMNSVAFDAMRDVLEIEYLLIDFHDESEHLAEWASMDERHRLSKFSPVKLRKRQAEKLGINQSDLPTSSDYRGHSQQLHVTPDQHPFATRGIMTDRTPIQLRTPFWDMYQHGHDLVFAVLNLLGKGVRQSADSDVDHLVGAVARERGESLDPRIGLPVFFRMWDRFREEESSFWDLAASRISSSTND